MKRFTIRVPASSANLGPGFDCLALALTLYNVLEVEVDGDDLVIEIEGEGESSLPRDATNRVIRAAQIRAEGRGEALPGMHIRMINGIPVGGGLGSSAAAAVAGMLLADALAGVDVPREELLRPLCEMEGHADNAAASLFGGLVMVQATEDRILTHSLQPPDLWVALALPSLSLPTSEMRRALPAVVSLMDAAANIGSALLTVEALRNSDYGLLAAATEDRLHQPHRVGFIPGYSRVVDAAKRAGAAAIVLSGAGPGILAFATGGHAVVAAAMVDAFQAEGLPARSFVLGIDRLGASLSPQM
jgi:homoserine kinase